MLTEEQLSKRARALAGSLEAFAAQVYFSPECHKAYEALGFSPSPGANNGVALPDGAAYFTSRGSVMGQVQADVVAAAFGVFNPAAVRPAVEHGWSLTDAETICQARTDGAVGQLERILGDRPDGLERATALLQRAVEPLRPEGRPLFAGLRNRGLPGSPLADAWRLADMLREYRGDAHTASYTSHGFDATEIGLITELFWGLPMRTYVRSRAWSDAELDAAEERLEARGLVAGGGFTDAGRAEREAVEVTTDRQCRPIVEALGDDCDELVGTLRRWSDEIRTAGGYPAQGPHDLARRT